MSDKQYTILLVDDEPDILEFLSYNLKKEGYNVLIASSGKEAISITNSNTPNLILLDVMMPEMDGIETCEIIRKNENLKHTVIAFLSARNEDYSQIAGFEAGADDYVPKPIKPKLLISRIKALLKRAEIVSEIGKDVVEIKSIIIDRERYVVIKEGLEVSLPRKEFELLSLLASKPDRVFGREEIYEKIWGNDVIVGDRTIDVHIRKLREKIGERHIQTIKGVGYKFTD